MENIVDTIYILFVHLYGVVLYIIYSRNSVHTLKVCLLKKEKCFNKISTVYFKLKKNHKKGVSVTRNIIKKKFNFWMQRRKL